MATMEERVSRLEGIVEQINERLANVERGMEDLRAEIRGLQIQMLTNFRWTVGILFGMWITVIGAVLGALLAR